VVPNIDRFNTGPEIIVKNLRWCLVGIGVKNAFVKALKAPLEAAYNAGRFYMD
jgi:hypothetical protein